MDTVKALTAATSVKISELPTGTASASAVLIMNNIAGTETQRVLAGDIAALSGPVHSVAGRTGAITLVTSDISGITTLISNVAVSVVETASPVQSVAGRTGVITLQADDITDFNAAAASVALTAAPVSTVNGTSGAVSLNSTSVGAASLTHTHNSTAVIDFVTAVATGERWATVTITNSILATAADVYRLTASTTTELRGITAAVREGITRTTLINVGTNAITVAHAHNADSTAFLCPGGVDFVLNENQWAHAKFDPSSDRWRVVPNCCGST